MVAKKPQAKADPEAKKQRISIDATMGMRRKSMALDAMGIQNLFSACEPVEGAVPKGFKPMAMDNFTQDIATNNLLLDSINSAFEQGYAFPGFTALAYWAIIPEYRRPTETYAREMTRKWIKFTSASETDENGEKAEKLKQIEAEFKRLNVQAKFREAIEQDGFFGRSQIFLVMDENENREELKSELVIVPEKIGKGDTIKRLAVIEPIWSYPNRYNADDPLNPTFYKPTSWFVMGKEIHSSRLLTIVTREVPDILKPAYAFAGLSLSQMMKPYVDNWLRTRQSVSDLIHAFTTWVLETYMTQILNGGAADDLFNRLQIFNLGRDNHGVMALNKDTEHLDNVSAPLSGLDKLQAQSQEHMCAPSGLPLVYLTGITPAGLNASSQGEIEVFQDNIGANQEIYSPHVQKILNIVQLYLFGEIDPDIGFEWIPLKTMSKEQEAGIRKTEAETDQVLIDSGVISPQESRERLASEDGSPYGSLDLSESALPEEIPGQEKDEDGKPIIEEHDIG